MKHPQTLALKLNEKFPNVDLRTIGNYGCCILTLMWCLKIDLDDAEALMKVKDLIRSKAIKEDCTVMWFSAAEQLTGRKLKEVRFEPINSIKGIKERTPVLFTKGSKGHWVGVEKGRVKFNPLEHSVCVEEGIPSEMRVLVFS